MGWAHDCFPTLRHPPRATDCTPTDTHPDCSQYRRQGRAVLENPFHQGWRRLLCDNLCWIPTTSNVGALTISFPLLSSTKFTKSLTLSLPNGVHKTYYPISELNWGQETLHGNMFSKGLRCVRSLSVTHATISRLCAQDRVSPSALPRDKLEYFLYSW